MRERDGILGRPTNARLALLSLLVCGAFSATALAAPSSARPPAGAPARIVFPIVGPASYQDDFGDPRGSRSHEGNDLMSVRRAPVVAVEPGRVRFWTTSASAGCMLYLYGRSGATYLYIHLNNDLTDGNDNRGRCKPGVSYAPGLENGQKVSAGQLIGYVGDSGDADGLQPHLHFELHPADGAAVSPYRWLRRADKLLFAPTPSLGARTTAEASTLVLAGQVRAAAAGEGDGSLTVRIRGVRLSSERWEVTRNVTLSLPATAILERRSGEAVTVADLAPGTRVTVYTAPVELTLATQLARPGTLTAARVVVR